MLRELLDCIVDERLNILILASILVLKHCLETTMDM